MEPDPLWAGLSHWFGLKSVFGAMKQLLGFLLIESKTLSISEPLNCQKLRACACFLQSFHGGFGSCLFHNFKREEKLRMSPYSCQSFNCITSWTRSRMIAQTWSSWNNFARLSGLWYILESPITKDLTTWESPGISWLLCVEAIWKKLSTGVFSPSTCQALFNMHLHQQTWICSIYWKIQVLFNRSDLRSNRS